jgi:hypothetical protein
VRAYACFASILQESPAITAFFGVGFGVALALFVAILVAVAFCRLKRNQMIVNADGPISSDDMFKKSVTCDSNCSFLSLLANSPSS